MDTGAETAASNAFRTGTWRQERLSSAIEILSRSDARTTRREMDGCRNKSPPGPMLSEPRAPREHARLTVGPTASRSLANCDDDEGYLL